MAKLKSHGEELKEQDAKIAEAEKAVSAAVDDASRSEALRMLSGLWAPYHPMIEAWHEMFYPKPPAWDPDHNPHDMVVQEMTDAHKQMNYIKSMEARLKAGGGTPDDGKNS